MSKIDEIKYAMENRLSLPPDQVDEASLRAAGCMGRVFLLPEPFNERASYMGDVLVQMVTRKPKDDDLRFVVGQLCQALSYTLNSTSWRDGKLHDFDLDEIRRKVGRLGCRNED